MKKSISTYVILILVLSSIHLSSAQDIKWLRVGQLQSFINSIGANFEGENTIGNTSFFSWPAQYGHVFGIGDQTTTRAEGLWIGCKNFDDSVEKKVKSFKVIGSGPRDFSDRVNQIFTQEIKLIGKFPHPSVLVDDQWSVIADNDQVDSVDENLPCDRIVLVRFNTSIGISVTKKVMAFSSSDHGNYFINDYVFKNTGIVDGDGTVHSQTLTDVWFYFVYRNAFAGVTSSAFGSTWGAFESQWGESTLNHDFGVHRPLSSDPSLRGFYSYYGPSNRNVRPGIYEEDWGCPNLNENGILGSAKYAGCVTIHADNSALDSSDDLTQPKTTAFISSDISIMGANVSQYDETFMADKYTAMSEGHLNKAHDEEVGNQYPYLYTDPRRQSGGGTSQGQGYGPYTLAPGDSIHIVFAEGASGLSWEACREIGSNWLQWRNTGSGPTLTKPDGSTTTDYNGYKNAWIFTGKDSIIKTFQNARKNFQSNYNLPQPPPPPSTFNVASDADGIHLTWEDNAIASAHFDGYVIYRSEGSVLDYTTVYKNIFECSKANVVHKFDDTTAALGFDYYYYIQSKDDGSTNTDHPGVPLYSSLFYTITEQPAHLITLPAGYVRSYQSGSWNDINTWEQFNGSKWIQPISNIPNNTSGNVTIRNGHTVTLTANDSIDQLFISSLGTLVIEKNVTLKVKNGDSTDMIANGTVNNYGTITKDDSATIQIALYYHKQNGGVIPIASINTCVVDSVSSTVPLNTNQNFLRFIWDCPKQIADINLGWNGNEIENLILKNSGNRILKLCDPLIDSTNTIVIGNVLQSGGEFAVSETNNPGTTINIINGNLNITGGKFSICNGSQGGTGTTMWYFGGGSFSNATVQNLNPKGAKFLLGHSGVLIFGSGNSIVAFPLEVSAGATLTLNGPLIGSGNFTLDSGATLEVTHGGGIDSTIKSTGLKSFKNNSSYIFSGKSLQVTGSMLPDTIDNLIIKNGDRVMLSKSVNVIGNVEIKKELLMFGGNTLSYGPNATLKYAGTSMQTTTDAEFPLLKGPKNVIVTNSMGITLHASRTLSGNIICNGNVLLGNNSLMVDSIFTYTYSLASNPFIASQYCVITNGLGNLKLTNIGSRPKLFPIGTIKAYAPVWIASKSAIDTIGIRVTDDLSKPIEGGRVKVKWYFSRNSAGGRDDSIRFGWADTLEDDVFKTNLGAYGKICRLSDTTEVGTGVYKYTSLTGQPGYTVRRGGITIPDSFFVGYLKNVTNVEEMPNEIPFIFSLRQNYPNPFNPSTTIAFGIPSKSYVSLKIYDVIGREVTTIVSEELSAGNYKKQWNGQGVSSGVYFYRIHAGNFVETKKLILLK